LEFLSFSFSQGIEQDDSLRNQFRRTRKDLVLSSPSSVIYSEGGILFSLLVVEIAAALISSPDPQRALMAPSSPFSPLFSPDSLERSWLFATSLFSLIRRQVFALEVMHLLRVLFDETQGSLKASSHLGAQDVVIRRPSFLPVKDSDKPLHVHVRSWSHPSLYDALADGPPVVPLKVLSLLSITSSRDSAALFLSRLLRACPRFSIALTFFISPSPRTPSVRRYTVPAPLTTGPLPL